MKPDPLAFLGGSSEMAHRMRAFDWSSTPLGAAQAWPPTLKAMVRMALTTRHPIFIFWGRTHICFYNDAYSASLGPEKHPAILGACGREAWPEIWHLIGPQIDLVMRGEGATWHENQLVPIVRHGQLRDVYWTYSYGPIEDEQADTGVGGVLVICSETTQQVEAARRAATESEALSRLFYQATGFMAVVNGPDHRFEWANPAYMRMIGDRSIIGLTVAEALPEAVAQGYVAMLDTVYRSGEALRIDKATYRAVDADGRPFERVLDFVLQPMQREGGVEGIFVEGHDVTERTWIEAALRQSESNLRAREEQLRLATELAEIGLWDFDVIADRLYWNARTRELFGVAPDAEVSLSDFYAGLHPQDRDRISAAFAATRDPAQRALYDVEYRTIGRVDGIERWVASKGKALFDAQDRCVRVLGSAIDIGARKADESQLRELNETLEARVGQALAERSLLAKLVESSDEFVVVVDLDMQVRAVNRAGHEGFARVLGVEPIVGKSLHDQFAHAGSEGSTLTKLWQRALAGETFTTVEAFGDGATCRHLELRFTPLRDEVGRRVGAYQFGRDVTDRVHAQAQLERAAETLRHAQKMESIGQLTGGLAHDFNNVLQAAQSALQLIRRTAQIDSIQGWADNALRALKRGGELTSQLLAFAREQKLELRSVALEPLLRGMTGMVARSIGPLVRLQVDPVDPECFVRTDATQLEMAILNLAINARDAMPEGGKLSIRARARSVDEGALAPGEYVEIAISDTGSGMASDVAARAFEPFFTTKGVGKGTGLGLSQVYAMARQCGGQALINSVPGAGTTVTLMLPLVRPVAEPVDDQAPIVTGTASARLHVLLVDDDNEVRSSLAEALSSLGYRVLTAANGLLGLTALKTEPVDVMVIDFAMPGMNGAQVAARARALRPGLPLVLASGYADTVAIQTVTDANTRILRKPFDVDDLRASIEALVGDAAAAAALQRRTIGP